MAFHHIAGNLAQIRARIAASARDSGRDADAVTVVAVSKTHPQAAVEAALAAGQRVFGENRVQEAQQKYPALKERYPDLILHLIGPLQTNKVRDAVALFDVIETVDRPRLAAALAAEMTKTGKRLDCFIEVNTGEEAQKAGIAPDEAGAFVAECRGRLGPPLRGLMGAPPPAPHPAPPLCVPRGLAPAHHPA